MDTCLCIRELISYTTNINRCYKSTILLYRLKADFLKMLTCRDPWSSLYSQDFRYDTGDGRVSAEI